MTPNGFLALLAIATALTVAWHLLRAKPVPWWNPAPAPSVEDRPIDRLLTDLGLVGTVPAMAGDTVRPGQAVAFGPDGTVAPLGPPAPQNPDPFAAPCDCGPPLPPLPAGAQLVAPLVVPLADVLRAGYTEILGLGPFAVVRPICSFGPCTAPRPLLERFCPLHAAAATRAAPDAQRN
jgi:hypothetical protein